MRHSSTIATTGDARVRALGVRHIIIVVVAVVAAIWAGVAFAQEAYISHRLSQAAADLRHQNAVLSAQNQGYRRDVQAITSGAANEEEARLNGYARSNERLYLVTAPASPVPSPSPTPSPTR